MILSPCIAYLVLSSEIFYSGIKCLCILMFSCLQRKREENSQLNDEEREKTQGRTVSISF
jgi:hypothetical protein